VELDPDLPGPWVADPLGGEHGAEGDPPTSVGVPVHETLPAHTPCDDCKKAQRINTLIGMGIGVVVGGAVVMILTRPKGG